MPEAESMQPNAPTKSKGDIMLEELRFLSTALFTSKWILECIPYIFDDDRDALLNWKLELATNIKIDSSAIIFVGSAATGKSLNPNKNFRDYNEGSDIDIAVIS